MWVPLNHIGPHTRFGGLIPKVVGHTSISTNQERVVTRVRVCVLFFFWSKSVCSQILCLNEN